MGDYFKEYEWRCPIQLTFVLGLMVERQGLSAALYTEHGSRVTSVCLGESANMNLSLEISAVFHIPPRSCAWR